jgi:hypothetical protein
LRHEECFKLLKNAFDAGVIDKLTLKVLADTLNRDPDFHTSVQVADQIRGAL